MILCNAETAAIGSTPVLRCCPECGLACIDVPAAKLFYFDIVFLLSYKISKEQKRSFLNLKPVSTMAKFVTAHPHVISSKIEA